MTYRTTVGWSLRSSGILTLLLVLVPGDSPWWGIALTLLEVGVLAKRQS